MSPVGAEADAATAKATMPSDDMTDRAREEASRKAAHRFWALEDQVGERTVQSLLREAMNAEPSSHYVECVVKAVPELWDLSRVVVQAFNAASKTAVWPDRPDSCPKYKGAMAALREQVKACKQLLLPIAEAAIEANFKRTGRWIPR